MSHGPAGERARRAWGRYNYAFIAEISFCFSDAIPVSLSLSPSRTDDVREGEGGESCVPQCPPGRGKR